MSRRRYVRATILWAGLFSAGFAAVTMLSPRPRLMWNASASAPVGLYRLEADARPRLGELVAIVPSATTARMMANRSEEHTSELQSLMRITYAVLCLKKKKQKVK